MLDFAGIRPVLLWTDAVLWLAVLLLLLGYGWQVKRQPPQRQLWARVWRRPEVAAAAVVLGVFVAVAMLDSLHFRRALPAQAGTTMAYDTRTESVLDLLLARPIALREVSYSAPLSCRGFQKETVLRDGKPVRDFPRLKQACQHLRDVPEAELDGARLRDLLLRLVLGAAGGGMIGIIGLKGLSQRRQRKLAAAVQRTVLTLAVLSGVTVVLAAQYHVLGTDRTGNDVLVQAFKSVRTAFVIGTLASLATLPLALGLGILAGMLRGWVDALIQYLYTLLSSIPSVLLIAACVLMVQVQLDTHPHWAATPLERADLKIFLLCVILGITGWTGLCRLLRAETLKLRELEFVQAATALGVGRLRIMARHILPNVMHLVLITTVLEFSSLILYEAVLSYVGVGVDPSLNSFGGMINLARSEMSRDPVIGWSFGSAFVFMVTLVLAANLFADGVRDAFDPKS
jgi:peptide/nickel transport system permease protein